ncbi:MAG: hypothetical protein QNJ77_10515 [Acidimicrobiia bacterium]|nr:hypothetical protein [Acidimicrobiia bacterium]
MRRVALLVVVAALVAAACSGEKETETFGTTPEDGLVDAMSTDLSTNSAFDDEVADCIGRGLVDEFGADGLAELGVTPEDPDLQGGMVFGDPGAARPAVDVLMGCIDIPDAIVTNLLPDMNLLEDSVQCLADQLQSDVFRDLFAELIEGGVQPLDILTHPDAQLSIGTLFLTCLSVEEMLRITDLLNL